MTTTQLELEEIVNAVNTLGEAWDSFDMEFPNAYIDSYFGHQDIYKDVLTEFLCNDEEAPECDGVEDYVKYMYSGVSESFLNAEITKHQNYVNLLQLAKSLL